MLPVKNAMQSIIAEASRIEVMVNNAGCALNGAMEELSRNQSIWCYETRRHEMGIKKR
ncbi:MAG: hypothetical protein WAM14_03390 [Candidatus Nitrosopolaris sp.]